MEANDIGALIKSKDLQDRVRAVKRASRLSEEERQAPLLQLLGDRANYVAAMAAEVLGEFGSWNSAAVMRQRFLWLSEEGLKRDPGCHIRSHLAYAFGRLEYTPAHDALRIGIRTVQVEAVGGVPFDTAASLRANCALALAYLREPNVVREIAPLLFDNGENSIGRIVNPVGIAKRIPPEVRKKMAQALGATGDPAAAIPLAIKLRFPEGEAPEVLQECMQALIHLETDDAVHQLSPYLAHHDTHLAAFAALMIAQTNSPEAPELLKAKIEELYGDPLRAVILAIAGLRSEEARAILHNLVDDQRMVARLALVEALVGSLDENDRACLRQLADKDSYPQVRDAARAALD